MDSNQGYNLYKWVICPLTRVINLHMTSKYDTWDDPGRPGEEGQPGGEVGG